MNKNFVEKIVCLFAMILFICTIGTGVGFAAFPFVDTRAAETPAQFVAVVNGTSIDFDWTAMSVADSYTMAVALQDISGNVDMGTLQLFDMGVQKTFSTSGLPSGAIFYAAILANTAQGLVVSNTLKFMPFAGVVTYPEVDDIIMQLDDPGGIGSFTVYGSPDGEIEHIAGDDGTGPFIFTVTGGKPATYTKGDLVINFINRGNRPVEMFESGQRLGTKDDILCMRNVKLKMIDLVDKYEKERLGHNAIIHVLLQLGGGYGGGLLSGSKGSENALFLASLIVGARDDLAAKFAQDKVRLEGEYDDCGDTPDPDPDPTPDPYNSDPNIGEIDASCQNPPRSTYEIILYKTSYVEYYVLNGVTVGPWLWKKNDGTLKSKSCNNIFGELHGWAITYHDKSGNMLQATHYKNGIKDGHEYVFYCDGSIHSCNTYWDGMITHSRGYNKAGKLCTYSDIGDPKGYVVCGAHGEEGVTSPYCE